MTFHPSRQRLLDRLDRLSRRGVELCATAERLAAPPQLRTISESPEVHVGAGQILLANRRLRLARRVLRAGSSLRLQRRAPLGSTRRLGQLGQVRLRSLPSRPGPRAGANLVRVSRPAGALRRVSPRTSRGSPRVSASRASVSRVGPGAGSARSGGSDGPGLDRPRGLDRSGSDRPGPRPSAAHLLLTASLAAPVALARYAEVCHPPVLSEA